MIWVKLHAILNLMQREGRFPRLLKQWCLVSRKQDASVSRQIRASARHQIVRYPPARRPTPAGFRARGCLGREQKEKK